MLPSTVGQIWLVLSTMGRLLMWACGSCVTPYGCNAVQDRGEGIKKRGDCVCKQIRVWGGCPGPDVTPHVSSLFSPSRLWTKVIGNFYPLKAGTTIITHIVCNQPWFIMTNSLVTLVINIIYLIDATFIVNMMGSWYRTRTALTSAFTTSFHFCDFSFLFLLKSCFLFSRS